MNTITITLPSITVNTDNFTESEVQTIFKHVTGHVVEVLSRSEVSRSDIGFLKGGVTNSAVQTKFGNGGTLSLATKEVHDYVLEEKGNRPKSEAEKVISKINKLSDDDKKALLAMLSSGNVGA